MVYSAIAPYQVRSIARHFFLRPPHAKEAKQTGKMRVFSLLVLLFRVVHVVVSADHESAEAKKAGLRSNHDDSSNTAENKEDNDFWQRFLENSMPPSPTAPGSTPPPTDFPTLPPKDQDRLVTCISVIDENDSKNVEAEWDELRVKFPDRPFCLLRPIAAGAGGGLSFPPTFFNDARNIFANVTRDAEDVTNPADWYEICNLDAGKPQGLTNVVLFVDNSGSMYTSTVQTAFDLFAQRVAANGFTIVMAVENSSEDYIDPCLLTSILPPTSAPVTSAPASSPVATPVAPAPAPSSGSF